MGHDLNAVLLIAPVRLPRVKGVEAVGGLVELLARVRIYERPLRDFIRPTGPEPNCVKINQSTRQVCTSRI